MKKNGILITIIVFLLFFDICFSKDIEIENLFKTNDIINREGNYDKFPVLIENAIKILNKEQNSIVSCCTISIIPTKLYDNEKIRNKFIDLHEKYYATLNDGEHDTTEKIVLAGLLHGGFSINGTLETDVFESQKIGENVLLKFIETIHDDNYKVLAMLMLGENFSCDEQIKLYEDIMKNYPDNKSIPLIEFRYANRKYSFNNSQQYVDELLRLFNKYKNHDYPYENYKFSVILYPHIIETYLKLKQFDDAKKYYDNLQKEAPDHYSLEQLQIKFEMYTGKKIK